MCVYQGFSLSLPVTVPDPQSVIEMCFRVCQRNGRRIRLRCIEQSTVRSGVQLSKCLQAFPDCYDDHVILQIRLDGLSSFSLPSVAVRPALSNVRTALSEPCRWFLSMKTLFPDFCLISVNPF